MIFFIRLCSASSETDRSISANNWLRSSASMSGSSTSLMSMSLRSRSLRSSWNADGSRMEEKSKLPSCRSNAPLRSNCSLLASNWKESFSISVSTENREEMSRSVLRWSASKRSPVSTFTSGSASCCFTTSLSAAWSMA